MKSLVIYDSVHGNTEKIAEAIAAVLGDECTLKKAVICLLAIVTLIAGAFSGSCESQKEISGEDNMSQAIPIDNKVYSKVETATFAMG